MAERGNNGRGMRTFIKHVSVQYDEGMNHGSMGGTKPDAGLTNGTCRETGEGGHVHVNRSKPSATNIRENMGWAVTILLSEKPTIDR